MTYLRMPVPSAFTPMGMRVDLHRVLDELLAPAAAPQWEPAAEAREDATGYTIAVELPGVAPEAVELVAEEGTLLVRGERAAPVLADGERAVLVERRHGRFARRFRLPKHADLQEVTASAAHGVLTIRVPKALPSQPRRITVQPSVAEAAPTA